MSAPTLRRAGPSTAGQSSLHAAPHPLLWRRYDESNHKRLPPSATPGVSPAILVQAGGRFFYATAARLLALKFILSMTVGGCRASGLNPVKVVVALGGVVAAGRRLIFTPQPEGRLLEAAQTSSVALAASSWQFGGGVQARVAPSTPCCRPEVGTRREPCLVQMARPLGCPPPLLTRWILPVHAGTLQASADVLAMASLEVDISGIAEGDGVTVKWRGKPVFIRHR